MVDDLNPFDLAALRVDPERVRQPARPKKWRRQFVRVPWQWVERLQAAKRISTYRLALVLLYETGGPGGRPIALSNVSALQPKVCPRDRNGALSPSSNSLGLITGEAPQPACPASVLAAPAPGTIMSTIVHSP